MLFVKMALEKLINSPEISEDNKKLIAAIHLHVIKLMHSYHNSVQVSQHGRLVGNHGYQMRWLTREVDRFPKCANG